ncbi:MAG: transcriptional regulator swi6 [Bathelium mastoideum]|nr:MAG: transcriptional regulator swi6 [Bathelium mastoideum]
MDTQTHLAPQDQKPMSVSFSGVIPNDPHRARASFEARPASFHSTPAPPSNPQSQIYYTAMANSHPSHAVSNSGAMMMPSPAQRSFDSYIPQPDVDYKPQIYTASYSGVSVYEMEVHNVAVMRRRSDSWLNATQILKVAGVDKGKRTKVLEKEILTGEHEKVQGGYGKYQGTWISYQRGREFCRAYGVEELLRPLLDYDVSADGSGAPGQGIDTPTKEQAMAANRKRFYNTSLDARGGGPLSNGTFFSNISPTASNAIAAMNKAARLNSPAPRSGSTPRRPGDAVRRPSQQPVNSQETHNSGSQQSVPSLTPQNSFSANGHPDSGFATQSSQRNGDVDMQEPPRKKVRQESSDSFAATNGALDVSMRDGTPTEPNESFMYSGLEHQGPPIEEEAHAALPPLPAPSSKAEEERQAALLDLFADLGRNDLSQHPAITQLSGADLEIPLDQSANTALHWAATLGRVPLMRLLIAKGANIRRGNVVGQTPLMAAVQVNNCLDHSCFPELLEILAPLIEVRDHQGRTILHHIAVSCGIKGRAPSSKYYLEALLEFLVRNANNPASQASADSATSAPFFNKPINLMKFMSEMVNARDKGGNTALNLVARIGNRNIIQQLIEVQADATIPNYKGLRPIDFGVGNEDDLAHLANLQQLASPRNNMPASKIEESHRDIASSITSLLSQTESQFNAEIRIKQDQIDRINSTLRDLSAHHRSALTTLESLQRRLRTRTDRTQKIANLRTAVAERRRRRRPNHPAGAPRPGTSSSLLSDKPNGAAPLDVTHHTNTIGDADAHLEVHAGRLPNPSVPPTAWSANPSLAPSTAQAAYLGALPPPHILRARLAAYTANAQTLKTLVADLRRRDGELESRYRRVVSLCTGVEEGKVEGALGSLVAAVESERGGMLGGGGMGGGLGGGLGGAIGGEGMEVGRVREFLRKVEGVAG